MNNPLEVEVNQLHAEICAGLADPKRILILYTLYDRPMTVNALAECLELAQPIVSRHLKILRERGMVKTIRKGVSVEYHLNDVRLVQALDLLRAVLRDHLTSHAELAGALVEE